MPPIAEQVLAQPLAELRNRANSLLASSTSDEAYQRMNELHTSVCSILENVCLSLKNAEQSIVQLEQNRLSTRKPFSESRCASNLKVQGSDKSEFKNWNKKLINAMSQSLGGQWRQFMNNLNCRLDQDRKVLEVSELNEVEGASQIANHDQASEDLYYVWRCSTQSQFG